LGHVSLGFYDEIIREARSRELDCGRQARFGAAR